MINVNALFSNTFKFIFSEQKSGAGSGKDSQLLLWLSKSTAFIHHWLWTLQSLGVALQRPNPGSSVLGRFGLVGAVWVEGS